MNMKKFDTVYIDGDEVIYSAGFASQHTYYYVYCHGEEHHGWVCRYKYKKDAEAWINNDEDFYYKTRIEVDSLGLARYNTKQLVKRIFSGSNAKEMVLLFNGDTNFRDRVATIQKYKGNRDNQDKPVLYQKIKDFLFENYPCEVAKDIESDDLLSIYGSRSYFDGQCSRGEVRCIIATKDKDLDMVPGWRYHTGKREIYWVDERIGRISFYLQILTGDATDNIPGLYKVTGTKASKRFKDAVRKAETFQEMYAIVWYTYWENSDMNDEEVDGVIAEIGDLLWMLQFGTHWKDDRPL